jgi:O-acetyl-ADP-ribose deacetylase (regulator of RNase III)
VAELEVMQADVTALDVDAIANAANTRLLHGGGVAGAISSAGGPEVQRESHEKAPIGLGEAVETTAGVGGFPLDEAARIMVGAARRHSGDSLDRIVFAVHGDAAERAFRDAL